jgi:hypothetical protein
MIKHQRMKQTVTITALSLILILWLAFPGYAEDGNKGNDSIQKQMDVFKRDPISFRLALSQQNNTNIFSLFLTTDNRYALNQKNLSQQMEDKNLPSILQGKPKKNDRLSNSLFTASLLTFTALNIADYVSTVKALKHPCLEEGNPFMRPFTKNMIVFSAVKLGISTLDFYLLKNIYKKSKPLGWVLSIAANLAVSYVVSHNIRKIQAVSGK